MWRRVDFVTSPGFLTGDNSRHDAGLIAGGMYRVVTDLGILGFDEGSKRMQLLALHPGVTADQVQANTGFELLVAADLESPTRRPKTSWRYCAISTPIGSIRPEEHSRVTIFSNTFGLAMRNFTTYPEMPDPQALIDYAVKAEELGFDSVWVWDHIFLGVDPPFPVIELADPAGRGGGAHDADQARHRRAGVAVAQPGGAGEGAVEPRPDRRRPAAARHGFGLVQARVRCGRRAV